MVAILTSEVMVGDGVVLECVIFHPCRACVGKIFQIPLNVIQHILNDKCFVESVLPFVIKQGN